jgi:hypothetical protein
MSVVAVSMGDMMAPGAGVRRIADLVVAAAPAGVRIRTRIHLSGAEAAALTAIGALLGSVYRGELAGRIGCGVLDAKGRAAWRAERKQAITAVSSSRWAGAITRAAEDQYQLGMRRTVAGIPTARFRTRLIGMAARRGIAVIGVDAAYTSRWGAQHWRTPLQQQTSDPVTRHHAAAAAIGRRGLGLAIRRRPAGPRTGQRTAAGTPPARPDHQPNTTRRCRSSGPPTHPPRGAPVHRTTPPAAANTVRAAQDSLLLTNQERSNE